MDHLPESVGPRSIENLLLKCKNSDTVFNEGLYDQDTAAEFHRLFIATFIAYASALSKVKSVLSKVKGALKNTSGDKLKDSLQTVLHYGLLFVRIVSSTALKDHLTVLEANQLLAMPTSMDFPLAKQFAGDHGIIIVNKQMWTNEVDGHDEDDDDDDDEREFFDKSQTTLDGKAAQSWIKSLVDHFIAARIIQHHCGSLPAGDLFDAKFVVVAVEAPNPELHHIATWKGMCSAIRNLSDLDETFDAERAIQILKDISESPVGKHEVSAVDKYGSLCRSTMKFRGRVHCECGLVAIIRYLHLNMRNIEERDKVIELLKVSIMDCSI